MYLRSKTQGRLRCQKRRSLPQPVKNHKITSTNIAKKLLLQRCSKPLFSAFFNFSHKRPTFAFTSKSGYTLAFANRIAHSGLHAETGAFRTGRYYYPRRALRAAETPDGRLSKRLTCRFLRSGEQRSLRSAYFFRIYRIFCRQFQLQTLLRYGIIIFPATCTCNLRFILKDRLLRNVSVIFCRVMI